MKSRNPHKYRLFRRLLVQRLHGGDFTGDSVIALFILPFPDFVNPNWFHCRKQPVIKRHIFIPVVVKSVVKIWKCLLCTAMKYLFFNMKIYCFFICRKNNNTANMNRTAAYPSTHQIWGKIPAKSPASTARSISTAWTNGSAYAIFLKAPPTRSR